MPGKRGEKRFSGRFWWGFCRTAKYPLSYPGCIITSRTIHYPQSSAMTVAVTQDDRLVVGWRNGVGVGCQWIVFLFFTSCGTVRTLTDVKKDYGGYVWAYHPSLKVPLIGYIKKQCVGLDVTRTSTWTKRLIIL